MKLKNLCAGLRRWPHVVSAIGAAPAHAQDKKPYIIYLSNNFVGNDWRQQMQRVATVSVRQGTARRAASTCISRSPKTPSRRRSTR